MALGYTGRDRGKKYLHFGSRGATAGETKAGASSAGGIKARAGPEPIRAPVKGVETPTYSGPDRRGADPSSAQTREFFRHLTEDYGVPASTLREIIDIVSSKDQSTLLDILGDLEEKIKQVQLDKAAEFHGKREALTQQYRQAASEDKLHKIEGKNLEYAIKSKGPDFLFEVVDMNQNCPEAREIRNALVENEPVSDNDEGAMAEIVRAFRLATRLSAEVVLFAGKSLMADLKRKEAAYEAGLACYELLQRILLDFEKDTAQS